MKAVVLFSEAIPIVISVSSLNVSFLSPFYLHFLINIFCFQSLMVYLFLPVCGDI